MSEETCGAQHPRTAIGCLRQPDHPAKHATVLCYHPEPYDEWEWVEWADSPDSVEVSEG